MKGGDNNMRGYLDSNKLSNVKGRMKYITDENKQENIVDYHNTTNNEFWKLLAKESREQFKNSKTKGQCCEARELIIGIPQKSKITAKQLCEIFKNKYGVECNCAIHQNIKNGIVNRHCHLIFSERKKLEQPKIIEEKRAARTYYYDSKGKKCSKDKAVKVVKKGDITQKGQTRYFSNKGEIFKQQQFIYDCKELFLKDTFHLEWSYESEKRDKELSEKHIGKNNPKEEYIKNSNELKSMLKNVCNASDFLLENEKGSTLKDFKKVYEIDSFVAPKLQENEDKVYCFIEKMQDIYKEKVHQEIELHNNTNEDINLLQADDNNYAIRNIQRMIIDDYEERTKTRHKPKIIEFLKEKIINMFERIEKLIDIQNLFYIEPKNRIEIIKDKTNGKIYTNDESHIRKEKSKDDYELEL